MTSLRTLITPVIIASLTITGLAAVPAKASSDDVARVLFGLGALAIIAKAVEDNQKSTVSTSYTKKNAPRVLRTDRTVTAVEPRRPSKRAKYALPENCLRTYNAARGERKLYSGRCLDRLPYKLAKLPDACAFTIAGSRGNRGKAYGPRCMARNGFFRVATVEEVTGRDRHIVYRK